MLKNSCKSIFAGLISVLFVLGVFATSGLALEGKAGEVIKTVEELKELHAKGLLHKGQLIIFSEVIRDFGWQIPIVETKDRTWCQSNSYKKYTQMNKGKASIGTKGELVNYAGAGLPFPDLTPDDPQSGVKAAWNFDYRSVGDDNEITWWYKLTDNKGNVKHMEGVANKLSFAFRTDLDPKPNLLKKNPHGIWRKQIIRFTKPFSSKGLAQLTVRHIDTTRDNNIWVYVPGLRRNIRVGAANRCDSLGGFVHAMDDAWVWSGPSALFNWKILEVKDMLVDALMPAGEHYQYLKGAHNLGHILERRNIWIIEQTPKFEGHCYSKKIMLLDPDCWSYSVGFSYDRAGRLWRGYFNAWTAIPNPERTGGGAVLGVTSADHQDFRIWETAPCHLTAVVNQGKKKEEYTLDALRRVGR